MSEKPRKKDAGSCMKSLLEWERDDIEDIDPPVGGLNMSVSASGISQDVDLASDFTPGPVRQTCEDLKTKCYGHEKELEMLKLEKKTRDVKKQIESERLKLIEVKRLKLREIDSTPSASVLWPGDRPSYLPSNHTQDSRLGAGVNFAQQTGIQLQETMESEYSQQHIGKQASKIYVTDQTPTDMRHTLYPGLHGRSIDRYAGQAYGSPTTAQTWYGKRCGSSDMNVQPILHTYHGKLASGSTSLNRVPGGTQLSHTVTPVLYKPSSVGPAKSTSGVLSSSIHHTGHHGIDYPQQDYDGRQGCGYDIHHHRSHHPTGSDSMPDQFKTIHNITVIPISSDIVKVEADAVVTSENPDLVYKSQVTESLCQLRNEGLEFRKQRSKVCVPNTSFKLGDIFVTNMNRFPHFPFKYVFHAVLYPYDYQRPEAWMNELFNVYMKVLKEVDEMHLESVTLPFLGTGNGRADPLDAVEIVLHALANFEPQYLQKVYLVSLDDELIRYVVHCCGEVLLTYSCQDDSTASSSKTPKSDYDHTSDGTGPRQRKNAHTTVRDGKMVSLKANDAAGQNIKKHMAYVANATAEMNIGKHQSENIGSKVVDASLQRSQYAGLDTYNRDTNNAGSVYKEVNSGRRGQKPKYPGMGSDNPDRWESMSNSEEENEGTRSIKIWAKKEDDICPICMDAIKDAKKLPKCGHVFCRECIDESFKQHKPVCPSCNMAYGVLTGNMPEGTMNVRTDMFPSLPGYEGDGLITIEYYFPDGTQTDEHPHPGKRYRGTSRTGYLPNNKEGQCVLALLDLAFDRKLTFTVGRSVTTGRDDCVVWNDIHHKTRLDGGPTRFGYPDETYLSRVKEELASKGVTEDQLDDTRPNDTTLPQNILRSGAHYV